MVTQSIFRHTSIINQDKMGLPSPWGCHEAPWMRQAFRDSITYVGQWTSYFFLLCFQSSLKYNLNDAEKQREQQAAWQDCWTKLGFKTGRGNVLLWKLHTCEGNHFPLSQKHQEEHESQVVSRETVQQLERGRIGKCWRLQIAVVEVWLLNPLYNTSFAI